MNQYRFSQTASVMVLAFCTLPAGAQISNTPLAISTSAPPTVLFNVSVEGPMSGPAYPDDFGYPQYDAGKTYIGLFGEDYCYGYTGSGATGYFTPEANATAHVCTSSRFSGNFLNWATMKAIDSFALTLTGGNRVEDSATRTVLQGARKGGWTNTRSGKTIPAGAANVSGTRDIEYPDDYNFRFGSSGTKYNIRVEVCKTGYLQSNYCDNFGTSGTPIWKPKGLVQDNAEKMRFALSSYTKDDSADRDGGVLRSLAKYVGPRKWDDTTRSFVTNGQREWYPVGHVSAGQQLVIADPDGVAGSSGLKSGVINYVNAFSNAGYKDLDPAGELFYESLNYFRKRGPTPEYSGADTANGRALSAIARSGSDARAGGHWFYNSSDEWNNSDAIKYSCQKNFIVAINDANPWLDKRLPGTYFTADKTVGASGSVWRGTQDCINNGRCNVVGSDFGQPSTSDTIDVTALTNAVGTAEGAIASGTWTQSTTTIYPGLAGMYQDSVGGTVVASGNGTYDEAWDDCAGRSVAGVKLGEVMGTCPGRPKQNSYYIAGLAHWANTSDLRPDMDGIQKVNTFFLDTQEPTGAPLDGPRNMLWLAAKYGGFVDLNKNGIPDLQDEWDKNGDGIPDNYMLASDPQRLKAGLTAAFANIIALNDAFDSSSSAVAANSTRLDTGSIVYQMKYDPKDWTGQLVAYALNSDGTPRTNPDGTPVSPPGWDSDTTFGKLNSTTAAARKVLSWNPDARAGADFKCTDARMNPADTAVPDANCGLTNTQRGLLREAALPTSGTPTPQWGDLLNYLRGDPTNERGASPTAAQRFRFRNMTLGDIVNSDPLHVGDEDLGYEQLPATDGGEEIYAAYRFSTETRRKVLYVGANDGMFHGFDALTGAEIFSFVPNLSITGGMKDLAQPGYTHRFFVDGGPTFGDVAKYNGTTWQWKTYVASNMAAGGRGVFLLDVSNPNAMDKTKVTWEFGPNSDTSSGSKSGEIGNVMSQVKLVRLQNKRWAVVFGNGPNGASKTAKLFVVYVDADLSDGWTLGSDYLVFDTDTDNGSANGGNGLGGVAVVGDSYLTATYAYAGDLQGRLWKFDLTTIPTTCPGGVCGTATKLFTTKTADDDAAPIWQPITSAPAVGLNSKCGYMVYFGTGRYYAQGDPVTTAMQTMYAIWDQPGGTTALTASSLYEYQIAEQGATADGTEWRVVKDNNTTKLTDLYAPASTSGNPDVCKTTGSGPDAPTKRGWFLDLNVLNPVIKNNGERIVTPALLRHGRVIFTTLEPSREFCVGGGKSWIMETKAEQGGPLDYSVFDINKDGSFAGTWNSSTSTCTGGDCVGSGNKSPASGISTGLKGIIKSPTVLGAGGVEYKIASGSSKGELVVIKEKGSGNPRASWRQLR